MREFRISIVGRARVGKSLLLTRFVNNPDDIKGLSNSGADSTKVPTELILSNDIPSTSIECHYKGENQKSELIPVSELAYFHEKIRLDDKLQDEISHLVIKAEPSDWVKKVLKKTDTTQLVIIDTEGVSGDVKNLNLRNWKVNLFILLFRSENKVEFAKSIGKMKSALFGNNIWYAVSLADTTLPDSNKLDSEIIELEEEAQKMKNEFSDELNSLEDKKSLLNMKLLEFKRKDTVLAIPNIKLRDQYKVGRDYTDKKLESFLLDVLKNNSDEINIEIDEKDTEKRRAAIVLLQHLSDIAMNVLENEEVKNLLTEFNETIFNRHLDNEYRLKSHDNGYLVEKQWRITSNLRVLVYEQINEITFNPQSPLSDMEQAALVQKFYNNFAKKVIWTNDLVYSTDGRESTEQASIILMLHARGIVEQLNNTEAEIRTILEEVIDTDYKWRKNYLSDLADRNSRRYVPIYLAANGLGNRFENSFDKFYELVIKPYTIYAVYYTLMDLGFIERADLIREYQ